MLSSDPILRYRAWIVMGVVLIAVILATTLAGNPRKGAGRGGAGMPHVVFGSQVQKLGATSQLIYTNGWEASSGRQWIAVYAGRQSSDSRNGLFVIARQARAGHQSLASVVVRRSGALTLLRPAVPASEQAAFTETLHFVTANGGTGTLDLGSNRVTLSG